MHTHTHAHNGARWSGGVEKVEKKKKKKKRKIPKES